MPRSWFEFSAMAAEKSASIAIRGYIGDWGVNDQDFSRDIESLGEVENLSVSINSRGGDIVQALSIFNILRNHRAHVTVRVDGVAASSASIIAMAADEIVMPANTLMLVHRPLIDGWITAGEDDLRALADDLAVFQGALVETYKARTGKSEDELKTLLAEDRWMTAEEAVELGFADRVEELNRPSAVALAEAVSIPESVIAKVNALEAQADASAEDDAQLAAQATAQAEALAAAEQAAADVAAARESASKNAAAIAAMCTQHGVPHLAAKFIEQGLTAEKAAVQILDAKAQLDEQRRVDPVLPVNPGPLNPANDSWGKAFSKVRN